MLVTPQSSQSIASAGSVIASNNSSTSLKAISVNGNSQNNDKNKNDNNNNIHIHKHKHVPTNERVEISNFVSKFQKTLGDGWDAYQIAVSLFIVGKLSRAELINQISPVLSKKETRHMHNRLLMSMLANCYRMEPLDGISTSLFGNTSRKRKIGNKSSQYEQLKKDVLSLSIRERVRIKAITKDSGKKSLAQNVMILTRQAMVPKVPIVTNNNSNNNITKTSNKETGKSSSNDNKNTNSNTTANTTANSNTNNLEMTLVSVKDILDMINEPLCTETYELPERKRMRDIMLGLAREHGLLGGVSMKAVDVLYIGLQYHLKSIITNVLDNIRAKRDVPDKEEIDFPFDNSKNKTTSSNINTVNNNNNNNIINSNLKSDIPNDQNNKSKKITITIEDMFDSFSLTPHMIQPYGTVDFLNDVMLKNDDDYDLISRRVLENSSKSNNSNNTSEKVINLDELSHDNNKNNDNNYNISYVIPNKVTDVSYLLKSHETILQETSIKPGTSVPKINLALKDKDIGTPDELSWVINDLLAEDI